VVVTSQAVTRDKFGEGNFRLAFAFLFPGVHAAEFSRQRFCHC